jgi:hypothetical protein
MLPNIKHIKLLIGHKKRGKRELYVPEKKDSTLKRKEPTAREELGSKKNWSAL